MKINKSCMSYDEPFIWHWSAHKYFGEDLFFILIRYRHESILFKPSIEDNLSSVGVTGFSLYDLYGSWDLLIRFWCDSPNTAEKLYRKLRTNNDIRAADLFIVRDIQYLWDGDIRSQEDVFKLLNGIDVDSLSMVQIEGQSNADFSYYVNNGVIIKPFIFDRTTVKFYVLATLESEMSQNTTSEMVRWLLNVNEIKNISIYHGRGVSANLIVKGEAGDFYNIYHFLTELTQKLAPHYPQTQTAIVARPNTNQSDAINFNTARKTVEERLIRRKLPDLDQSDLQQADKYYIRYELLSSRDDGSLKIDKDNILIKLLNLKIHGEENQIPKVFDFPSYENELRNKLPLIMKSCYGKDNWKTKLDEIKQNAHIEKKLIEFGTGEINTVIKAVILEKNIIPVDHLTSNQFNDVMDAYTQIRNMAVHGNRDLTWEEAYSFFKRFIWIYYPLFRYIKVISMRWPDFERALEQQMRDEHINRDITDELLNLLRDIRDDPDTKSRSAIPRKVLGYLEKNKQWFSQTIIDIIKIFFSK